MRLGDLDFNVFVCCIALSDLIFWLFSMFVLFVCIDDM